MTTSSEIEVAAVEPHAHHGAVENQPHDWLLRQRAGIPCVPVALHLAPHSAHRVLANLPTKYAAKCTPHAARIGAGKIHTGDQRVGSPGAALIIPQYPALPFRRLAAGNVQPGARHRDIGLSEVPISVRTRLPCRWPVTTVVKSLPSVCPARRP